MPTQFDLKSIPVAQLDAEQSEYLPIVNRCWDCLEPIGNESDKRCATCTDRLRVV